MSPSAIAERSWLARHGIAPRRRLGQSFLIHPQVATRLARAMSLAEGDRVLEVGAGAGALTRALLDRGCRVWAVEIDPRLIELLEERFAGPIRDGRLALIHADIREVDPAVLDDSTSLPFHLAGNLPYAITSPILIWILEKRASLRGASVLVQREVAARLTASPGGKTYGSLTVWVAYHATARRLTTVGPGSFWPVPEVESALVGLAFHSAPPVDLVAPDALERLLAATFGKRRKMLRASLGLAMGDRERAESILREAGIDPTRRAETLTLAEFARLANQTAGRL